MLGGGKVWPLGLYGRIVPLRIAVVGRRAGGSGTVAFSTLTRGRVCAYCCCVQPVGHDAFAYALLL